METPLVLISSPIGVIAVLSAVAAFFFLLAQVTKAKLFNFPATVAIHLCNTRLS